VKAHGFTSSIEHQTLRSQRPDSTRRCNPEPCPLLVPGGLFIRVVVVAEEEQPGDAASISAYLLIEARWRPPSSDSMRQVLTTGRTCSAGTSLRPGAGTGSAGTPALADLAQLRAAAIRNALTGHIQLPGTGHDASSTVDDGDISGADLLIPLGDVPVPVRDGQPCPPGIAPSGCRLPRPPGSPVSPGSTPPG
jgi:hypothetical protein